MAKMNTYYLAMIFGIAFNIVGRLLEKYQGSDTLGFIMTLISFMLFGGVASGLYSLQKLAKDARI